MEHFILIPKIIGTRIYYSLGQSQINVNYNDFDEKSFEMTFDNDEENCSTITLLPNGNLCIYTCVGDEQPSSTIYIIKDWKIEYVKVFLPKIDYDVFESFFERKYIDFGKYESSVPKELMKIFEKT